MVEFKRGSLGITSPSVATLLLGKSSLRASKGSLRASKGTPGDSKYVAEILRGRGKNTEVRGGQSALKPTYKHLLQNFPGGDIPDRVKRGERGWGGTEAGRWSHIFWGGWTPLPSLARLFGNSG